MNKAEIWSLVQLVIGVVVVKANFKVLFASRTLDGALVANDLLIVIADKEGNTDLYIIILICLDGMYQFNCGKQAGNGYIIREKERERESRRRRGRSKFMMGPDIENKTKWVEEETMKLEYVQFIYSFFCSG